MIDSFITYDSNQGGLGSPGFFTKNFDDMFRFALPDADPESYDLLSSQPSPPENNDQNFPKEAAFEAFSTHSGFSTNPSIKHSPEYAASPEQGDDDEQYAVPTKNSGVVKKGIRKQYEPIVDNNIVYRYEENPCEYRKARKRIQNRESATRVRNRKKTHVEELEEEMDVIRQERAELKVQNASLVAENNMLKQQITFLERIVSRGAPEDMIDNTDAFPNDLRTETSDSMLHFGSRIEPSDSTFQFINKSDEDIENAQPACKYFRAAPTHQFKKQVALLGVFTLLLCVYGLLPRSEPLTVQLFSRNFGNIGKNSFFALPPNLSDSKTTTTSDDFKSNTETGIGKWMLTWSIEIVFIIAYIACLASVGIKAYRRHQQKKTNMILTPL